MLTSGVKCPDEMKRSKITKWPLLSKQVQSKDDLFLGPVHCISLLINEEVFEYFRTESNVFLSDFIMLYIIFIYYIFMYRLRIYICVKHLVRRCIQVISPLGITGINIWRSSTFLLKDLVLESIKYFS